jgi:hypothetical protein
MTAQLDLFAPISPTKSINVGVMGEGVTQNVAETTDDDESFTDIIENSPNLKANLGDL